MNDDFAVLLFFFGISVTANIALATGLLGSRRRARRLEERILNHNHDDRTDRLEQVVEGLTVQIDQITSAQEFLSRVITNRLEKPHGVMPKAVTPR
ncbi:MAG TPA: hypothetical protein VI139_01280 [Gemmatimonadales bacterium]